MITSDSAKLTSEEFFAWTTGKEGRHELVDGEIVALPVASRRHDLVVTNLIAAIRPQVTGGTRQMFTGATYVVTGSSNRLPDLGVDSGNPPDESVTADKPSLVVEVLSPNMGGIDLTIRLSEFQHVALIDDILLVDTESPRVQLYRRGDDRSWRSEVIAGLEAVVELERLEISLPLRAVYEDLEFKPRLTLVQVDQDAPSSTFGPK
jgi:Uma2 family endonuclease